MQEFLCIPHWYSIDCTGHTVRSVLYRYILCAAAPQSATAHRIGQNLLLLYGNKEFPYSSSSTGIYSIIICCMYRYILCAAALQKALQRTEFGKICCCCREIHYFPTAATTTLQQQQQQRRQQHNNNNNNNSHRDAHRVFSSPPSISAW